MNEILGDSIDRFAMVYLDDILIYSKSRAEHMKHVKMVLDKLQKAQLIVNKKKCVFGKKSLTFLGFEINSAGIRPDQSKIAAIRTWPTPTNVQEVRAFIGLTQHFRRFVPQFAAIATPLTDLTRGAGAKKRPITWTPACEASMNRLKTLLTTAPVLLPPNMTRPFRIETDASDVGIGAVLLQPDEHNQWHPVAYESKKLSAAERNYPAQERELLAILYALRSWRCLIEGTRYTVLSDHQPLKYLKTQKHPTPRLTRWLNELELYSPQIDYKPGKDNDAPDALSRITKPSDTPAPNDMEPDYLYLTNSVVIHPSDWPIYYTYPTAECPDAIQPILDRQRSHFVVLDNKVHRLVDLDGAPVAIPFVPFSRRADTVERYHQAFGHAGKSTMLELFRRRFWWPSMLSEVPRWIQACPRCQLNGKKDQKSHAPMHPLTVPPAFSRWHLDFIGLLPTTTHGNRWIITAVDYTTNWPIARAVPDATAEVVADFIHDEIVMRFGCPSEILTDRGANFTSHLLSAYMKKIKSKHLLTSAYHPRTNGKCERLNGILKTMLRKYVNGALHRWDDYLHAALWACRIRRHRTIGFSPFYLTYGRHPRLPGDTDRPYIDSTTRQDPRTIADMTARELEKLGQDRAAATHRMKAMAAKDKTQWDKTIKQTSFEVGDAVKLTHEGRYGLEPKFKGPYIVTRCFPDYDTYQLETIQGAPLTSLVHADRLMPVVGDHTLTTPWYDPTAARRTWRQESTQALQTDDDPSIPPAAQVDNVDPIQEPHPSIPSTSTTPPIHRPSDSAHPPPVASVSANVRGRTSISKEGNVGSESKRKRRFTPTPPQRRRKVNNSNPASNSSTVPNSSTASHSSTVPNSIPVSPTLTISCKPDIPLLD
jgi:transposase InsO family protein